MKNYLLSIPVLILVLILTAACTSMPTVNNVVKPDESHEILFAYADGRMEFNSRYINSEDVVIYADGRGGERAAVKVRVPLHSDFYRDSIIVVRVVNKLDGVIGQHESKDVNNIN